DDLRVGYGVRLLAGEDVDNALGLLDRALFQERGRVAGQVRRDDQVRDAEERALRSRGSTSVTSSAAASICRSFSATCSAVWSISGPRAQFTMIAVGFILANASASMMW